jgi:putative Mn2+ efflux pump MntP
MVMQMITIALISVGLAADALAVSLGIGATGQIAKLRSKLRLAAHLGIFQAGMTALGWLAAETIVDYIKSYDHWIAFGLLSYVGLNEIRSGLIGDGRGFRRDPSTGRTLVILSVATSMDALAVGLSIAVINIPLLLSVAAIGGVTFGLAVLGMFAGKKVGEKLGRRARIVGGMILIGIGVRILVTHLFP